jgi:radical SAM protein with 4Fe4S-binding SPASM domain
MAMVLSAPLFAQLELTEGCNHRCGYCSNPFSENRARKLTPKEADRALDELLSNRVFSIVLTGGEPFTNRAVLHHSLDRLRDKKVEVYVNTNLSQPIDNQDIEKLKGADYVLVSFPPHNKERFNEIVGRESYEKVLGNLEKLTKEGIPLGVNQVVTPLNYSDVQDTAKFLQEKIGLREFSASPIIPTCSGINKVYSIESRQVLELASTLIEIEQKTGIQTDMLTFIPHCYFPSKISHHRLASHGCSAGRDSLIIGASGDVRKCALLRKTYGNIQEESLANIWQKIQVAEKPKNEKCESCMPHEYCSGGCEARANVCGGEDPYVVGLSEERISDLYKTPTDSTIFTLDRIMHRKEGEKYFRPIKEVENKDLTRDPVFEEWGNRYPLNLEDCVDCFAIGVCGGGCPYQSYLMEGDITKMDERMCEHNKTVLDWMIKETIRVNENDNT